MYGIKIYSHTRPVTVACVTMAMSDVVTEIRGIWSYGKEDVVLVINQDAPSWKILECLEAAIAASGELGISMIPVEPEPIVPVDADGNPVPPTPIEDEDDDEQGFRW